MVHFIHNHILPSLERSWGWSLISSLRRGWGWVLLLLLTACSTTSNLPEGEVLYTGIKRTTIHDKTNSYEESVALTEVEGALACPPNNSFMGSSSIRTPLPIGLWIYNSMVNKEHNAVGRWMLNTFGSTPITITTVNPGTRSKIATNTLQNYGYFHGSVDYDLVNQRNPRKQKVKYDIYLGEPFRYDTINYQFHGIQDSIVKANFNKRYLKKDGQFSVPDLQAEKERLNDDFRDNGYYYYRTDYIRYFADSMAVKNRVKMLVIPDLDTPQRAKRQWYIGNVHTYVRKSNILGQGKRSGTFQRSANTTPSDSTNRRTLANDSTLRRSNGQRRSLFQYDDSIQPGKYYRYVWQGKKGSPPVKPQVIFKNFRFGHNDMFSQSNVDQTITNMSNMQVFQSLQFKFTPRSDSEFCDTLDVRVEAVMDKLIDAEFDFSFTQKSNSQIGPKAGLRLSKRNAFGHGETFSVGLKGSYEWQIGNQVSNTNTRPDSWEAGLDASLTYPWIAFPGFAGKNTKYSSSSIFRISIDNLKRAGYYRLVSFGVDATYNVQTSPYVTHQIVPLTLTYNKLMQTSERFDSITTHNSALYASMRDQFIPAMQYIYTYDNATSLRKRLHTRFVATVKESGNVLSSVNAILGHAWNTRDKKLLLTPYSQFFKIHLELTNKFKVLDKSQLVTHLQLGSIFTYGNSRFAPYSELFYVGGANSIRAFGARTIGPGRYRDTTGRGTYLDQAGDFKFEANAEYRFDIVSNLNGAWFIDAGNVWNLRKDDSHPDGKIGDGGLLNSIALGTGFGLRYDLEFLVLRFDIGVGIHAPYDTGRRGYYNIPKFWDGLGFHFAVGYPF